jgi:hypothetical protein
VAVKAAARPPAALTTRSEPSLAEREAASHRSASPAPGRRFEMLWESVDAGDGDRTIGLG